MRNYVRNYSMKRKNTKRWPILLSYSSKLHEIHCLFRNTAIKVAMKLFEHCYYHSISEWKFTYGVIVAN